MARLHTILRRTGKGLLIILIILVGVYLFELRGSRILPSATDHHRAGITYSARPTILVPGWGGYTYSYNRFIQYAQTHHYAEKEMTIYVTPHDHVYSRGHLSGRRDNPLVQIIYTWNFNSSYGPHINQLAAVLTYLHQHDHLVNYNVVGHSYGGSAWVNMFFVNRHLRRLTRVKTAVLLGTPVEETLNPKDVFRRGLIHWSADCHFKSMMAIKPTIQSNQWPRKVVNVMAVAVHHHRTDGAVPVIQAQMMRPLFKHRPIDYHEQTFRAVSHSGLHQQPRILKYAMYQLWNY